MTTTDTGTTTIEPIDHREAMALASTAYERLADVVEQLDDGDWARPTDCDGWSVRDLTGHLVGAMRSAASFREMRRQQRELTSRTRELGGCETDHMTAVQVEAAADLTTAEVVAEIRALGPRAVAGRRRTPGLARRLVGIPVDMGVIQERWKLGYLIDIILTRDAWLHRIDLGRAVGAEPLLTTDHDRRPRSPHLQPAPARSLNRLSDIVRKCAQRTEVRWATDEDLRRLLRAGR